MHIHYTPDVTLVPIEQYIQVCIIHAETTLYRVSYFRYNVTFSKVTCGKQVTETPTVL